MQISIFLKGHLTPGLSDMQKSYFYREELSRGYKSTTSATSFYVLDEKTQFPR